jgi:hypothetical protein
MQGTPGRHAIFVGVLVRGDDAPLDALAERRARRPVVA